MHNHAIRIAARLGALLVTMLGGTAAIGGEHPPLLDGGIWQIGPPLIAAFTDESLEQEVGVFRKLGMDIILVQYSASQYDEERGTYLAYVPNDTLPLQEEFKGRDPIGAILRGADTNGVKVILGGLLMPVTGQANYRRDLDIWTSPTVMQYRKQVLERYAGHKSLAGYYVPNEPNPDNLLSHGLDPQLMIDATAKVIDTVKGARPDLLIVKSIGLYMEPVRAEGKTTHRFASIEYLDRFWRPWVSSLSKVDVWMVIDGVGTRLSNLEHTDRAQAWCKRLAGEFGKQFWVDVECAFMDDRHNYPFKMEELEPSLRVAAKHGAKLITFDYAHYMSRHPQKEAARRLHRDYGEYVMRMRAGN
jgi:hypothetical protein